MLKVNLLSLELQRKGKEGKGIYWLFALPAAALLICIPFYVKQVKEIKLLEAEITKVDAELNKPEFRGVEERLKLSQERLSQLTSAIQFIEDKRKMQKYWNRLLDAVSATLPASTYELSSLDLTKDGQVTMAGRTFSFTTVADLLGILNKSKWFDGAKLTGPVVKTEEGLTGQGGLANFTVACRYIPEPDQAEQTPQVQAGVK